MPDPTSRICFSSVLSKIILCKTNPGPIWMAWSGFGQTPLVWKQAGVQESSGPVFGRRPPARYHFPTFRLGSVLPRTPRIILCKTSPDLILFCLTVSGFGQTDPVRNHGNVQESFRPASGQCFPADLRIGPGTFTVWLRHRSPKSVCLLTVFRWCSNSSKFGTTQTT